MAEEGRSGGYPELERRGAMLRLLRRTISEAHKRGELRAAVSVDDVEDMAAQIGGNAAQAVALFRRLHAEGRWSGKLLSGYKGVPFSMALVEDLSSAGMREIGELPDPAEDLVRRLVEAARAIEESEDLPEGQKSVAKKALDELVHFARGLPPGVAVEIGSRLAG